MRFINAFSREPSPDDWLLWCLFWSCAGMLAGGLVILVALAWGVPQ